MMESEKHTSLSNRGVLFWTPLKWQALGLVCEYQTIMEEIDEKRISLLRQRIHYGSKKFTEMCSHAAAFDDAF